VTTTQPVTTTLPVTATRRMTAVAPATSVALSPRPARGRLPRLLAGLGAERTAGLQGHERYYGPLPLPGHSHGRSRDHSRGHSRGRSSRSEGRRPERLIDIVEAAGLTGRGGAGFPAGRKMRSVAAGPGRKVVVANGAEGEPASRKDRLLLSELPHLVLDGITLAAQAVGADEAYLCVHGSEDVLLGILDDAVEERRVAGLDPVPIQVTGIPGRYVSSEQSSIVQYLNGGPGKPTFSPPRPHQRGVNGNPTLVHNVETLAHLALIARYGDRWFRGAGLPSAPGSMLVTVSGAVARPGVYEIEMGTPIGQVVMLAGGPAEPLQALLVGGYFGAWLQAEVAWPVPMTHAGLKAVSGAMGAGIVIALPVSSCPIAETARVVRYLAEESAGQCGRACLACPPWPTR
jgi:NADH:ubiquinone oxidoreductase subunit F (NADH-binding)